MKKILTFTTLFLLLTVAQSQNCSVTVSSSSPVVCLGDQVTISAQAQAALPSNQFFNFNQNLLPGGWGTTGGANYNSNICGQSPDGTPYFWASTAGNGVPQITTANFDICSGGTLQFQMKFAVQGGSSPCEGPDEQDEGVALQYSVNNGPWVEFLYYSPGGYTLPSNPGGNTSIANGQTAYTVWNTFNVPIPPAAISTSTRFRWIQVNSSGTCCDNWGLDNIGVLAGPCLNTNLGWSNGLNGVGSFTFTPSADTCFIATLYDDNNNYLCESSPICIAVGQLYTSSTSATICYGDTYTLGANTYSATGIYNAVLSSVQGCDSTVTLDLTVSPQITNSFSPTLCDGQTLVLGTQTLSTTGVYQEVFIAADGCDSTVTANLTVFPVYSSTKDTTICDGFVYTFAGQNYTQAGSYPIQFYSINGCDSLVTLNIAILPAPVPNAGPDLLLCSDEVGSIGGAAIPGANYSWSGQGITDMSSPISTCSVNSSTPQVLTYVVSSDYLGCISTDTVIVTIVPYPVVNIATVAPQCYQGNLFNFTPGNNFLPTTVYQWNLPQSNLVGSTAQNPTGVNFAAAGTYQVTVNVSNGACATADSLDVTIYPEPEASLIPLPSSGCIPLTVQFENTSTLVNTSQWDFGNGSTSSNFAPFTVYNQDGTYTVSLVVTSAEGCVDTTIYNSLITAFPLPVAGFSPSPQIVFQDEPYIEVTDNSTNAVSWEYTVSSGGYYTTAQFVHQFYDTGYHHIHQLVTNQYGCTDETDRTVQVFPATSIFLPNSFTPNNDDLNTYFGAYGNYVREFYIRIYDRWGMKVFESHDINHHWDGTINGKPIKSDTYVYKVGYLDHRGDAQELLGHVTMIK